MPELPEIETIKNALEPQLVELTISDIIINHPKLRWEINQEKLINYSKNQKITSLERRAKYLLIHLNNNYTIIIHLGMSGKLLFNTNEPINKHDHVLFNFSNTNTTNTNYNDELRYRDARRFGMIDIEKTSNLINSKYLSHLGIEPLSKKLTTEFIYKKFKSINKSTQTIKNFLMDAKKIVGIGNIYACEALYLAKINPKTIVKELTKNQFDDLIKSIKQTIKKAIKLGGTSFRDYQHTDGTLGYFQMHLKVYQKENQTCKSIKCKKNNIKIKRITQNNRSTFYCPSCQKLPKKQMQLY